MPNYFTYKRKDIYKKTKKRNFLFLLFNKIYAVLLSHLNGKIKIKLQNTNIYKHIITNLLKAKFNKNNLLT